VTPGMSSPTPGVYNGQDYFFFFFAAFFVAKSLTPLRQNSKDTGLTHYPV